MMGTWKSPKTLQSFASEVIVKNFLDNKVFATSTEDCNKVIRMFESQYIPCIYEWWQSFPTNSMKVWLQQAIDAVSEANPRLWSGYSCEWIFYFFFKMITLDKINFIGNEYKNPRYINSSYTDHSREIESDIEINRESDFAEILVELIKACSDFPMRKLVLNGKLSHCVIEAILGNAPYLEVLSIPNLQNFRYDLLFFLKTCRNLRELYLPITEEDIFCEVEQNPINDKDRLKELFTSLFNDCFIEFPEQDDSIRELFPKLRLLDFGTRSRTGYLGCRMVLHQLNNKYYMWMIHGNRMYRPSLDIEHYQLMLSEETGNSFNGTKLTFTYKFLLDLNERQIANFPTTFPKCKEIAIATWELFTRADIFIGKGKINSFLSELLLRYDLSLYFIHCSMDETLTFFKSTLSVIGKNINTINIDSHPFGHDGFTVGVLQDILINCPSLKILRLVFDSTHSLDLTGLLEENFAFPSNKIRELWMREAEPEFCNHCLVYKNCNIAEIAHLWVKLMNLLQMSSTDLKVFSTNVSDYGSMQIVLENLSSNAQTLNLEHCKFATDIAFDQLKDLIERCPNLKKLYLKGVNDYVFWKLRTHFSNTGIQIFWGALNGIYSTYNYKYIFSE